MVVVTGRAQSFGFVPNGHTDIPGGGSSDSAGDIQEVPDLERKLA